jgi:hypothetical protein
METFFFFSGGREGSSAEEITLYLKYHIRSFSFHSFLIKKNAKTEKNCLGGASRPLCGDREPELVHLDKGVAPWPPDFTSAGHCAGRAPALVTSNHKGTLPSLIKKGNLGKTGAD